MIPVESTIVVEGETTDSVEIHELETCIKWIREHEFKKVCLQFPDNLLHSSVKIVTEIEKRINNKVYILGDTSYGSCCVDEVAAQHISADSIVHFGHACLNPTIRLPVFHILPKKEIDVDQFINRFQSVFHDHNERILFFYDVAYAYKIEYITQKLYVHYKKIVFTNLNCISNVPFTDVTDSTANIILGRSFHIEAEYSVKDYIAFFLGSGDKTFTTLALSIPAKSWHYYDNHNIVAFSAMNTPWLKRRRYLIEKLKDAKVVGIVVATLGINKYLKVISLIKNILKQKNIKTYILSVGKINPAKLANFPEIDAFVLITCPENEVIGSRDFLKPLLLPYEVELGFNSARTLYSEYCMDFRQLLPGGIHYKEFKLSNESDLSLITGELRIASSDIPTADTMNALAIKTPGTLSAIGKAGAQFLHDRSWKGVEQRLGKDSAQTATVGRSGLPVGYQNEPHTVDKIDT